MRDKNTVSQERKPVALRMTLPAVLVMDELAKKLGLSRSAVIEQAIRALAHRYRQQKILDALNGE